MNTNNVEKHTWEYSLWCSKREFHAIKNLTLLHADPGFADWTNTEELDLIDQIDIKSLLEEMLDSPQDETFPPLENFKKKSNKMMSLKNIPLLSSFVHNVTHDILQALFLHSGCQANLTPLQSQAIRQLKENKTITIKSADKSGNVVIMDTTGYKNMCYHILNNTNW